MKAEETVIYKSIFYGMICLTGGAGWLWNYYETDYHWWALRLWIGRN